MFAQDFLYFLEFRCFNENFVDDFDQVFDIIGCFEECNRILYSSLF